MARTTMKSLFDSVDTVPMSRIVQQTRVAAGTLDRRLARLRLDSTTVSPVVKRPLMSQYNVVHRPTARPKLSRCNMSFSVATELQRRQPDLRDSSQIGLICAVSIQKSGMYRSIQKRCAGTSPKVNQVTQVQIGQQHGRQSTLGQSSDKGGDRRLGGNDGMGNGECGLICLTWHT